MTDQDRSHATGAGRTEDGKRQKAGGAGQRPDPSARDVPPVGGVPAGSIRSVDLEPRSNGETEWQDEPEGPRPPRDGRTDD
jgi:hypothetical protein